MTPARGLAPGEEPLPGPRFSLPVEPLRRVVGSYVADTGHSVPSVADAFGLDAGLLAGVMAGTVEQIPAHTVKALSERLDLYPEDIWGGEMAGSISWVYGDLSTAQLRFAPPAPAEPVLPWLSPPAGEPGLAIDM